MTPLAALLVVLALAAPQEDPQEKPKVPKDSVELTVVGCLKGRVLKTAASGRLMSRAVPTSARARSTWPARSR